MKNLCLILTFMLCTSLSFAINSKNKEDIKSKKNNTEITENKPVDKMNAEVYGCLSTCYVNIENTETGEVRKVYGIGHGSNCAAALVNCGSNARTIAIALVHYLNNQ